MEIEVDNPFFQKSKKSLYFLKRLSYLFIAGQYDHQRSNLLEAILCSTVVHLDMLQISTQRTINVDKLGCVKGSWCVTCIFLWPTLEDNDMALHNLSEIDGKTSHSV